MNEKGRQLYELIGAMMRARFGPGGAAEFLWEKMDNSEKETWEEIAQKFLYDHRDG